MTDISDQMESFQARVKRIKDPRNSYYSDPETGMNIPKRVSRAAITAAARDAKPAGIIAVLVSVMIGAACVIGVRYLRFDVIGMAQTADLSDVFLITDLMAALIGAFFLGGLIRHKSLRHMAAQACGVMIMVAGMHNLVWSYPDAFGQLFSQDYIAHVQETTAPQTLLLRGGTFTL